MPNSPALKAHMPSSIKEGFFAEAYHGTCDVFHEFDMSYLGCRNNDPDALEAFFFSSSKDVALSYAYRESEGDSDRVIIDVQIFYDKVLEVDMGGIGYRSELFMPHILEAKSQGCDGVVFKNVIDGVGKGEVVSNIYAVFRPEIVHVNEITVNDVVIGSGFTA